MPKIRINPIAQQDLTEIKAYIDDELCNPKAAARIVKKIIDSYSKLEQFPSMGAPLSSIVRMQTNYRFLVCGNYLVFYEADEDFVSISRVLYGRRDYLQILFGNLELDEQNEETAKRTDIEEKLKESALEAKSTTERFDFFEAATELRQKIIKKPK